MQPNYNHPFLNPLRPPSRAMLAKPIRVDTLVERVLQRNVGLMHEKKISLELDVAHVEMIAHASLIERGIEALIHNAINGLPDGGQISVTLINDDHQWEFEVAETINRGEQPVPTTDRRPTPEQSTGDIPVLLPFPANRHLRTALDIAAHHRGQLQSWTCSGGGTAFVLVIPNRSTGTRRTT